MYILPEAVDDDVQDVPIVEYDMSLVDGFMSISSQGVLLIEDLSSSDVPIGTYSIGVRLSDGENLVERQIIVKVYDVSETPIVDDESSSTSEQEGSGGTGDTSQLNGSTSDGTSDGTSVTSEGSSAQVENDESLISSNDSGLNTDGSNSPSTLYGGLATESSSVEYNEENTISSNESQMQEVGSSEATKEGDSDSKTAAE